MENMRERLKGQVIIDKPMGSRYLFVNSEEGNTELRRHLLLHYNIDVMWKSIGFVKSIC